MTSRRKSAALMLWPVVALMPTLATGHSPHHVITDAAAGMLDATHSDTFILVDDQVFRSDDGGAAWKNLVNGLNTQYRFTSVAISPAYAEDTTAFVASSGDGVYRSGDRGESWARVLYAPGSRNVAVISVSPAFESDGRVLVASATGGLWRSTDRGSRWRQVLTDGATLTVIAEGAPGTGGDILYAGDGDGHIWHSRDGGRLWERRARVPGGKRIASLAVLDSSIYIASDSGGLFVSADGGHSYSRLDVSTLADGTDCLFSKDAPETAEPRITSLRLSRESGNSPQAITVFATTWYGGLFVSRDGGESWQAWSDGLRCDPQANGLSVAHFRKLVAPNTGVDRPYWLATFDGLYRSPGPGSRWQQLETLPLGLIKGMAVTGGGRDPLVIALSTYGGGFYLTDDGGSTWTIGNRGLATTRLTGLAFSPDYATDGIIYAGAIRRLLRSSDRGESWQRFRLDRPGFGTRVLNKLSGWGVPTGWLRSNDGRSSRPVYPTHIVPLSGRGDGSILFATRNHGVMTFDPLADESESVWDGTNEVINSLVMSPDHARDRTLFASIRGEGLYRSQDDGETWEPVNAGLDFLDDWKKSPRAGNFRRDVIIALSPGFPADRTAFAGSAASDGLFTSRDGGQHWAPAGHGIDESPAPVLAIAVSPQFVTDRMVFVSIKGGGLFRSVDGGATFESAGGTLIGRNASIEYLAFSPGFSSDRTIVAASDEQLFLSPDGGRSWTAVSRPVRYEDMRDVVRYSGQRERSTGERFSAMTQTVMSAAGSSASLAFVGDGIRLLGAAGPGLGTADIFIDGTLVGSADSRADSNQPSGTLFEYRGLGEGPHRIEVRVTTAGDGAARFAIDAFDVLPRDDRR